MFANQYRATQMVFQDDGVVPNSRLPVVIYQQVLDFTRASPDWGNTLSDLVMSRGWNAGPSYLGSELHYFSGQHRAIMVFGEAKIRLGGRVRGLNFTVKTGDVAFIPAGVGCEKLHSSESLDLFCLSSRLGICNDMFSEEVHNLSDPINRKDALEIISKVPLPENDPFFADNRLLYRWKAT